jgi:sporulation inhibitor KapD
MRKFKKYLYKGTSIDLVVDDVVIMHKSFLVHKVSYVNEIVLLTNYKNRVVYSKKEINKQLVYFFDSLKYVMYLDTEMTMPPYQGSSKFTPELIQAGLFITYNNEIVERLNFKIKPKINKVLNQRTKDFLHIEQKDIDNGVSYYKFYNAFKTLINKYHPAVVIFGKNDKLFLESSFRLNKLPSLTKYTRYVNLLYIIKNYYELNQEPGLFNLYEKYYGIEENQLHDALDDSFITMKVMKAFIDELKAGVMDEA